MADAIDDFIALPRDQQMTTLQQLSPEKQDKLLAQIKTRKGAKTAPVAAGNQPEARTVGNYASEIVRGVGRGLKNDVVGAAQTIAHPIDTATGMVKQFKAADQASLKEYDDLKGQGALTRNAASMLTFAENAPVIGGMVQHAEEGGTKPGSPEAVGSAVEATTTLEAPKAAAKFVGPLTKSLKEVAKRPIEAITKTGPRETAALVKDTQAANATEAAKAADANKTAAQAHLEKTQTALHETAGREMQHKADTKAAEEANAKAQHEHDQAVQVTDAANKAKMDEHAAKTQSVEQENAAKQAEFETAKAKAEELEKAAKEQETARGKAARAVKEQSARMVDRIKKIQEKWKDSTDLQKTKDYQPTGILDKAFDQIRKATAGAVGSSPELSAAVAKAEGKITGSTENLKIFRDILSKNPDADPEFVTLDQGDGKTQIPKGHPLYDILKQGQTEGATPPTWKDLQGYYTELGRSLSSGNLPGDVYQALRSLQDDIGSQMGKMAESKGVGAKWKLARSQYRDYMQTFREMAGPNHSGSPIAQSLAAKDPAYAIKPLTAEETAQRVRNDLSRFDPSNSGQGGAGQLFDNFRASNQLYDSLGKPIKVPEAPTAPTPKEAPPAPSLQPRPDAPKPAAVTPPERVAPPDRPAEVPANQKKLGTEDVRQAKGEGLQDIIDMVRKGGHRLASYGIGLKAMWDIFHGNLSGTGEDIAIGAAAYKTADLIANALQRSEVVDFLTKPTARDIAQIPPELRADMPKIIEAAKAKGIKVSPALITAVAITGPKTRSLQQTSAGMRGDQ